VETCRASLNGGRGGEWCGEVHDLQLLIADDLQRPQTEFEHWAHRDQFHLFPLLPPRHTEQYTPATHLVAVH
jgi:hypothetical protein